MSTRYQEYNTNLSRCFCVKQHQNNTLLNYPDFFNIRIFFQVVNLWNKNGNGNKKAFYMMDVFAFFRSRVSLSKTSVVFMKN